MRGNGGTTRVRWLHGGRPGLKPGQRVRPPAETGTLTSAQLLARIGLDPHANGMEADRALTGVVYLTCAEDLAAGYAAGWEHERRGDQFARRGLVPEAMRLGAVYEVAPAPGAVPDPDFEPDFPGVCVQASYASVLAVVKRRVHLPLDEWRLVMLRYTTWAAGSRCPACGHVPAVQAGCPCPAVGCFCEAARFDPTVAERVRG